MGGGDGGGVRLLLREQFCEREPQGPSSIDVDRCRCGDKSPRPRVHYIVMAESPKTSSGIPVDVVYGAESLAGLDAAAEVGAPGEYPFTRGIQPTMYRGRLWT